MGPLDSTASGKLAMTGEEDCRGKSQKPWDIALDFIMKDNSSFPFSDKFCEGEPLPYSLHSYITK